MRFDEVPQKNLHSASWKSDVKN